MYKDEMWYRSWSRAVDEHKEELTINNGKNIILTTMLKLGHRAKDFADSCKTCRGFQHPLTRLEGRDAGTARIKSTTSISGKYLATITDHMVKTAPSSHRRIII